MEFGHAVAQAVCEVNMKSKRRSLRHWYEYVSKYCIRILSYEQDEAGIVDQDHDISPNLTGTKKSRSSAPPAIDDRKETTVLPDISTLRPQPPRINF